MSYGTVLRQRIEALICGETGTTRTMAASRFHRRAPGSMDPPADSSERAIEVEIGPPHDLPGQVNNPLDGHALYEHDVTIRVHYALTHAGGDLAEGLTEQHGPGTWDAVRDRATTDAHDLYAVLAWHENHAGTDPVIIDLAPTAPGRLVQRPGVAVLELPYRLWVQATFPGSYAP